MPDARKCSSLNRDGKPCSATPRTGREHCAWHDPDLEANRRAGRVAGGRNRSNAARARKRMSTTGMDLASVDALLCIALLDLLDGELEPGVASSAATLGRAIATIRQAGDIEARLAALEAQRGGRSA